jgi:hypothetical protein
MFQHQESTVLIGINAEQILTQFNVLKQEIIELKSLIKENQPTTPPEETILMTRDAVAKFFKINISTVRNWSKSGILQPYYTGDRVYFKRDEILNALIPSNINY